MAAKPYKSMKTRITRKVKVFKILDRDEDEESWNWFRSLSFRRQKQKTRHIRACVDSTPFGKICGWAWCKRYGNACYGRTMRL